MKKRISITLLLLLAPLSLFAEQANTVFEMRTYHTNEGKLDALHARFRDHTAGLFEKHGMTNVGYWVPADQPNTLIYLMGYPDKAARGASWKAFLADPTWKAAYKASTAGGKLVAKIDSQFLTPTEYSPGFTITKQEPTRLFERRMYTTVEGKLDDLHARFADHTIALFAKHGITNLGYFVPTETPNTLVYFVAHKDEVTRKQNFKAFGQDPDWKTARDASEANGKILIPKGVQSTFLQPTDYSPSR